MSTENPYASPQADLTNATERRYAGFWIRVVASLIDSILILLVTMPALYALYGADALGGEQIVQGPAHILISYVLPFVAYIFLWVKYGGTPGKRILGLRIVSIESGEHLTIGMAIIRYIGYFVSMIALFLGLIWVAFNKQKRGWHDFMAGAVVIHD